MMSLLCVIILDFAYYIRRWEDCPLFININVDIFIELSSFDMKIECWFYYNLKFEFNQFWWLRKWKNSIYNNDSSSSLSFFFSLSLSFSVFSLFINKYEWNIIKYIAHSLHTNAIKCRIKPKKEESLIDLYSKNPFHTHNFVQSHNITDNISFATRQQSKKRNNWILRFSFCFLNSLQFLFHSWCRKVSINQKRYTEMLVIFKKLK